MKPSEIIKKSTRLYTESTNNVSRQKTRALWQAVEDGLVSEDYMLQSCFNYMSEDDVLGMVRLAGYEDTLDLDNSRYTSRKATTAMLNAVEQGMLDTKNVILSCLNYMSEDDVDYMVNNEDGLAELLGFDDDNEQIDEISDATARQLLMKRMSAGGPNAEEKKTRTKVALGNRAERIAGSPRPDSYATDYVRDRMATNAWSDRKKAAFEKNPPWVNESTAVTNYNPKSQGGTRKELLAKYAKTQSAKDATAARKAGATQKELQACKSKINELSSETLGNYIDKTLRKAAGPLSQKIAIAKKTGDEETKAQVRSKFKQMKTGINRASTRLGKPTIPEDASAGATCAANVSTGVVGAIPGVKRRPAKKKVKEGYDQPGWESYYASTDELAQEILDFVQRDYNGQAWFKGGSYAYKIDASKPNQLVASDGSVIKCKNVARGLSAYVDEGYFNDFANTDPYDWNEFFRPVEQPRLGSEQAAHELANLRGESISRGAMLEGIKSALAKATSYPQETQESKINELDNGPKGRVKTDKINYDAHRGSNVTVTRADQDRMAAAKIQDKEYKIAQRKEKNKVSRLNELRTEPIKLNINVPFEKVLSALQQGAGVGDVIDVIGQKHGVITRHDGIKVAGIKLSLYVSIDLETGDSEPATEMISVMLTRDPARPCNIIFHGFSA